jgi:hypothetical protein
MPATDNSSRRVSGRRRRLGIGFLVAIDVGVFRNAGHRLVRENSLRKTDVIVVLSGGSPFRAEAVAGVFKAGHGPAVWVSKPGGPQEEVEEISREMRRDGTHTVIIVTSP